MIDFVRHDQCKECSLCETANNPGLPTRGLRGDEDEGSTTAILFVGQSPGHNEDAKGKSFIGYTGGLLERLLACSGVSDFCDIFLANACRCRPPQGANETQSQLRKCREHLKKDVAKLWEKYKEVIIVVLGAKACYSVAHISSLSEGFKRQGTEAPLFEAEDGRLPRVFFTYHPAMLHPTRRPGLIYAVKDHFVLLKRYIDEEYIPNSLRISPLVNCRPPARLPSVISCDIETYGILGGVEQTVFNPHKSFYVDKVPYDRQIVTCAFGWEDDEGLKTAVYRWDVLGHRQVIRRWFQAAAEQQVTVVGQNFKFDMMYLAAADHQLRYWISPERLVVDDTLITGFLLFEQRPEKGLKEMATLFGIADYSKQGVTGKSGNATSSKDPKLLEYNCLDCAATLQLYKETLRRIEVKYGKDSPKLSKECKWVRNMILWDTFDLDMNGSTFDLEKLTAFHEEQVAACDEAIDLCKQKYDLTIKGTGSEKSLRSFMQDCMYASGMSGDDRVKYTEKTKELSVAVENVNLFATHMADGTLKTTLLNYKDFKRREKLISTYTKPTLYVPQKGIVRRDGNLGYVYPSWYPIPTYFDRGGGGDDKQGGQIQGRFSCKKPARMTEPKAIRKCAVSRWEGGTIREFDVSQDHLRMAALLSGDPVLMEIYSEDGKSMHTETGRRLFPDKGPDKYETDDEWKESREYKLTKTINFLVVFNGGADALRNNARKKSVEISLQQGQQFIDRWYNIHNVYREWQLAQVATAERQGYLMIPTGWSRTFGPPGSDLSAFVGEILNFMHQTPCAQLTQSCHYELIHRLRKYRMKSIVNLQLFDALYIDTVPGEEQAIDETMDEIMTNPPLMPLFQRWTGRTVPWKYDKIVYGE